jgi:DNA-binding NarL/FixJ family response regulator
MSSLERSQTRGAEAAKIRILIVDDHETVREGLKAILARQSDMTVIGEAADGESAVAQTRALLPDLVLMDISMPLANGLEATQTLKASCPQVKVLALTRHSDDGYLQQLLRAGAAGYVLKQSRSNDLLHAIRSVAAGGKYLDPEVAGRIIGRLGGARGPRSITEVDLSSREEEILRLVAWGYSNKEIAERLGITVKTVETHKANAMHKLGLENRLGVVRLAVLQGWLRDV